MLKTPLLFAAALAAVPIAGNEIPLDALGRLAVLEGGRIMPLDSYARHSLLQLSARSTYAKKPALDWLARVLWTPKAAVEDKVFRINNDEVAYALGIEPEKGLRYSFAQLSPQFAKLSELGEAALKIDEKKRTPVEAEMVRVMNNLGLYLGVMNAFLFAAPHPDFKVTDSAVAAVIGLAPREEPYSYWDIRSRRQELARLSAGLAGEDGHPKDPAAWTDTDRKVFHLAHRFDNWTQHYRNFPIHIVPPQAKGSEAWISPWALAAQDGLSPELEAVAKDLHALSRSFAAQRPSEFSAALDRFAAFAAQAPGGGQGGKLKLEVLYNRLDPFYQAKIAYGFALLASLAGLMLGGKWLRWAGFGLLSAGALAQAVGLGLRLAVTGRAPVSNLFETFVFVAWIAALLGLVLEYYNRKGYGTLTGAITAFATLLLSMKYSSDGDTIGVLVAVLNSNFWLTTHVITIILGYAGMCLSGVVGHVYLIQAAARPQDGERLNSLLRMIYATMAFGLIFSFIGTTLGGVWADQSWGRFWGWDPKENGALMIVLWGALLFHAMLGKMIGPVGFAAGSVIGIIVVMMAWFGINLLGVGLHSYGFTSGVANSLAAYVAAEFLFLGGILFAIRRRIPRPRPA